MPVKMRNPTPGDSNTGASSRGLESVRQLLVGAGSVARIARTPQEHRAALDVAVSGHWQLFVAGADGKAAGDPPVLSGVGPGYHEFPFTADGYCSFLLAHEGGNLRLGERHLSLQGSWNFRDLGGFPARNGRLTAWGRLFRTDGLSRLTPDDLAYLETLRIACVADFRTDEERLSEPDRLPHSVGRTLALPIMPGRIGAGTLKEAFAGGVGDTFMEALYRSLVEDEASINAYRTLFAAVQNEEQLPLMFHCSAGKDRTGFAAAVILLSLGVDERVVMADYMESARCLKGKYDAVIQAHPDRAALFGVKPSYLAAALDAVRGRSGSVDAYIKELGIDADRMGELFLQP